MKIELSTDSKSASFDITPDMTSNEFADLVGDWANGGEIRVISVSGLPDVIEESERWSTWITWPFIFVRNRRLGARNCITRSPMMKMKMKIYQEQGN